MLTIAGGIILAVLILTGVGVALGIISIPLQVLYWFNEAKVRERAAQKRRQLNEQYRERLRQIEAGSREHYPGEASTLRSTLP